MKTKEQPLVLLLTAIVISMLLPSISAHGKRQPATIDDFKAWLEGNSGPTEHGSIMLDDLQNQKDEVTDLVINSIKNKLSYNAVWAIRKLQLDPNIALPVLSEVINSTNRTVIKLEAMYSLTSFGKPGIDELINILEKNEGNSGFACSVLGSFMEKSGANAKQLVDLDRLLTHALLETTKASLRLQIASALRYIDGAANTSLLRILKDVNLTTGYRSFAALAISGKVDVEVIEYMLSLARDTKIETELRISTLASIVILEQLDITKASKVLIAALSDKDDQVQRAAALLLKQFTETDEVLDALVNAAQDSQRSTQARVDAIFALRKPLAFGNTKVKEALHKAIRSKEMAVRNEAFMILRKNGYPNTVEREALFEVLQEGKLEDRFNVAYILVRLWPRIPEIKQCLPIFLDVLKEERFTQRLVQGAAEAAKALGNAPDWLTSYEFFRWGTPSPLSHEDAFRSIRRIAPVVRDSLYKLLNLDATAQEHYFPYEIKDILESIPPSCLELEAAHTFDEASEPVTLNLNTKAVEMKENGTALFLKSMEAQNKTQEIEGIKLVQQALELEPRMPDAYHTLVLYYSNILGEPSYALQQIRNGMKHCPNNHDLFLALGNIYANMGQHTMAAHAYWGAISLGEVNASAYYNLSNSFQKIGDRKKEIAMLHRAIELNPKHLRARMDLAFNYNLSGDKAHAEEQLKVVVQLDPEGPDGKLARQALDPTGEKLVLLYMASARGRTEIVKQLLEAETDANGKVNIGGKIDTPLSIAKHKRHTEIAKLLKEYGAKE